MSRHTQTNGKNENERAFFAINTIFWLMDIFIGLCIKCIIIFMGAIVTVQVATTKF